VAGAGTLTLNGAITSAPAPNPGGPVQNLTVVVPFWNGEATLPRPPMRSS